MATDDFSQPALVIGLIYGCGALLELLIRTSQGMPSPLPPVFEDNICLVLVVFFLLPTILWPFISIYRIIAPIVRCIRECAHRDDDPDFEVDEDATSEEKKSIEASYDMEKGNQRK